MLDIQRHLVYTIPMTDNELLLIVIFGVMVIVGAVASDFMITMDDLICGMENFAAKPPTLSVDKHIGRMRND